MTGTETTVYEIPAPKPRDPDRVPFITFTDGEQTFRLRAPKLASALPLLAVFGSDGNIRGAADVGVREGLSMADAMWRMIDYIDEEPPEPFQIPNPAHEEWLEAWQDHDDAGDVPAEPEAMIANPRGGQLHGRARIRQRLSDPDDALDVDTLAPIFGQALRAMFANRPSQPSRGSSHAPRNGGTDSAAASSDQLAATSTS